MSLLSVIPDVGSFPPGLFKAFLNLWDILKVTYVKVYDRFVNETFDILGLGEFNIVSILLGIGLSAYIVFTIFKYPTK